VHGKRETPVEGHPSGSVPSTRNRRACFFRSIGKSQKNFSGFSIFGKSQNLENLEAKRSFAPQFCKANFFRKRHESRLNMSKVVGRFRCGASSRSSRGTRGPNTSHHYTPIQYLLILTVLLNEEIDLSMQLGGRKSVHEVNLEPVEEHNEQSSGSAWPGSPS
jgi:hypothetical protein